MKIYVVEMREEVKTKDSSVTDCVTMFVGSSIERARDYCKTSGDIRVHDTVWWFAIMEEMVDSTDYIGGLLEVWDWNCNRINYQPIFSYDDPEIKIVPDDWEEE